MWSTLAASGDATADGVALCSSGESKRADIAAAAVNARSRDDPALCYRGNAKGVDLNRNWPTIQELHESTLRAAKRIAEDGPRAQAADYFLKGSYLRKNHGPLEEYAGVRPFSEMETSALRDVLYEFRPHMLATVHSGAEAVLVPYHSHSTIPKHFDMLMKIANALVPQPCHLCRIGRGAEYLYTANGTMTDYAFEAVGVPLVHTLEVYADGVLSKDESTHTPIQCLTNFNPLKDSILRQVLERWRHWPTQLIQLSDEDQDLFNRFLSNRSALWPIRQRKL